MKSLNKLELFRKPLVLYPILFAAFPIIFLYAFNIAELDFRQILIPLGLSLAGTFLLWALLLLILQNKHKASLATFIFQVFFFSYGHIYQFLENVNIFVPGHAYLVPAVFLVWGYCIYFISRAKADFHKVTSVLNIIAVVLIVINLANIAFYYITQPRSVTVGPFKTTDNATSVDGNIKPRPDIYYIVLDEYAHPDTMKEWYGYDNSAFIRSLQDKGFYIADKSRVNSPDTAPNIAQVLNMEYLYPRYRWDKLGKKFINITTDIKDCPIRSPWSHEAYIKYSDNAVARFLKEKGYKYIYFGNQLDSGKWDRIMKEHANQYFNYYQSSDPRWTSEFQDNLASTTLLRPFYAQITGKLSRIAFRSSVLGTLAHLKEMPAQQGPNFIFAHVLCPHEAFVFGPNGEMVLPINYQNYADKRFYLSQYIFINNEIEKVVDVLIKNSTRPPVIVIMSDHGLRPHHKGIVVGDQDWKKILNAMYLPGMDKSALYDSISPVNTFRLILNHYFDAGYPMLSDD